MLPAEAAARALVGESGIGEAVADDHLATRQRRFYDLHQMVAPSREGDQRLGQRVHGVMQHQGAQLFGQWRAAGLAGQRDRPALIAKSLGQCLDMRGLARAIDALKTDEQTLG